MQSPAPFESFRERETVLREVFVSTLRKYIGTPYGPKTLVLEAERRAAGEAGVEGDADGSAPPDAPADSATPRTARSTGAPASVGDARASDKTSHPSRGGNACNTRDIARRRGDATGSDAAGGGDPQVAETKDQQLFLDCCGLVRRAVQDLKQVFGFVIGPYAQSYQYDTLLNAVIPDASQLQRGDLIFYTGIPKSAKVKRCAHSVVHVEVFVGGDTGEATIGSRLYSRVAEHPSYRIETSRVYRAALTPHFRSVAPWLRGQCLNQCRTHGWSWNPQLPHDLPRVKYTREQLYEMAVTVDSDDGSSVDIDVDAESVDDGVDAVAAVVERARAGLDAAMDADAEDGASVSTAASLALGAVGAHGGDNSCADDDDGDDDDDVDIEGLIRAVCSGADDSEAGE